MRACQLRNSTAPSWLLSLEEPETYFPTRPRKQAHRVTLCRQYDAGALRSHLRTYAHAHDAQVVSVVQRAGGPRARLLVAQSTDDIATHQRPQQDQALTGIVFVYALRE